LGFCRQKYDISECVVTVERPRMSQSFFAETVRSSRYLLTCGPAIAMRSARERTAVRPQWVDVHRDARINCEPTAIVMLQQVRVSSSRQLNQFA
jgi:hypothetical protein